MAGGSAFSTMKTWTTRSGYTIHRLLSGRCNVFAVLHGSRFILVDTGRKSRRRLLMKRIDRLCADGNLFAALILTHAHFDHAENAAAVARKYGMPVYVHDRELQCLSSGSNSPMRGVMGPTRLINRLQQERMSRWFHYEPVPGVLRLGGEQCLDFLSFPGVSVLHTPGHTEGSVSVIVGGAIALVGDAMHGIFPGNAFPPFALDSEMLLESWARLLQTGCGLFLPSHGGGRGRALVRDTIARWHTLHP